MSNHSPRRNHFYLLFPHFLGLKGGIEVYSGFLLKALQSFYPNARFDIFLRFERSAPTTRDRPTSFSLLPQTQFHYLGETLYDTKVWRRRSQTSLSAFKIFAWGLLHRPQLIIATELNYHSVACQWLRRLAGIPYWIVLHGTEAWDIRNPDYLTALRHANRVIAVSTYTRDRVVERGYLTATDISILPNAFDAGRFQIQPKPQELLQRYGLTPDQPVILTITRIQRFSKYKGYDQILRALPQIRQQIPNIRYILAGKGDDQPRVKVLIEQLNLQDCVTLAGFIPEEELVDHYNLCDVFAMPSKGEGFGIVYLEALACGKPVLAGNQDGAVDPLAQGLLGCLVDPNDSDAIARTLTAILQGTYPNPILYQPEQLRQKTIEQFEFAQFQTLLKDLLQEFGPN